MDDAPRSERAERDNTRIGRLRAVPLVPGEAPAPEPERG